MNNKFVKVLTVAVYTFSTKTKKPEDTALVERIKDECDSKGLNFSAFVISLLKEHARAADQVQRSK